MKIPALMIAAAATALAPVVLAPAWAQTTSNSTSTTTTSTTTPSGRHVSVTTNGSDAAAPNALPQTGSPAAASNTTAPGQAATGGDMTAAATSGGAFRPLPTPSGQDIVATLQASGEFGTFLKIADATSLTTVLKTTPGITVFAPTDAAFAAMPPASMDLKDQATLQNLQKLLTYHIVNAKVPPLAGHGPTPVTTVAGAKVTLDGSGPTVKINDANALQSQVTATNGVIYPIDKVLSPDYVPPAVATTTTSDQTGNTTTTTTTKKKSTKKHHS